MRTRQLFLTLALLCAMVQTSWAQFSWDGIYDDVWDGHTTTKPQFKSSFHSDYYGKDFTNVVVINTAAELAYIRDHWSEYSDWQDQKVYYKLNYIVNADIDMGDAVSWVPMANSYGYSFEGIFLGQGHTIRIHISGTDDNYQGLFGSLYNGVVKDIHVAGKIECGDSKYVGGIAGYFGKSGAITDCWVSADVSSTNGHVGGIVGEADNENSLIVDVFSRYWGITDPNGAVNSCIMTGNVTCNGSCVGGIMGLKSAKTHVYDVVMYGKVVTSSSQASIWIGAANTYVVTGSPVLPYNLESDFTTYWPEGSSIYRYANLFPYAVNINNVSNV